MSNSKGFTEKILQLKVEQIHLDLGTQPRAELNHTWVAELTEIVKKESEPDAHPLPKPIVFHDGNRYILASGFHRIAARKAAGQRTVEVKVREGSLRDAILFAASTNSDHGLQRTPADMRHVARILLLDSEWGRWSNKEISRWCKIREHYVGEERKKIKEEWRIAKEKEAAKKAKDEEKKKASSTDCRRSETATMPTAEDAKKEEDADTVQFSRGGKTITMKTGKIGKGPRTQKVKPVIRETEPEEIAKAEVQLKRSPRKTVIQAKKAGWTLEQLLDKIRELWEEIPLVESA